MKTSTLSLGLDEHDDHPRRLISWKDEYLLAYGGDDGTLTMMVTNGNNNNDNKNTYQWIRVRQWDDAIRAVTFSSDGKRVAVGFETGAVMIYSYDEYKHNNGTNQLHPFFKAAWQQWELRRQQKKQSDQDDNDAQGLLSQSSWNDDGIEGYEHDSDEKSFPGAPMSAPIRDLQFDPRCGRNKTYYLAIATEIGFAISNVTSSQTLLPLYLQEVGEKEHDSSGIRGLAYVPSSHNNALPSSSSTTTSTTPATSIMWLLATLGMDGRLCLWNVTRCDDPELDWELYHRDAFKCIAKPDVGELNGADAADRSIRPFPVMPLLHANNDSAWKTAAPASYLALPGQTDVLLRPMQDVQQQKFLPSLDGKGHIEPIVAMACHGDYLVTSGRDGRVTLWQLPNTKDNSNGSFVAQIGRYASIPTDLWWSSRNGRSVSGSSVSVDGSLLFIACANGTLEIVSDMTQFFPKQESDDSDDMTAEDVTQEQRPKERIGSTKSTKGDALSPMSNKMKTSIYVDDEADDDDNMPPAGGGDVDDVDNDAATVEMVQVVQDSASNETSSGSGDHNGSSKLRDTNSMDGDYNDDEEDGDLLQNDYNHRVSLQLPEPQAPFAPASTPLDLTRRLLCWNHFGVISLLRGDDGLVRNMINIEFTDVTARRPVSFTDNMGFILGALGEEGAIFATDLQEDEQDDDYDKDIDADLIDGLGISERTKDVVKKSQRQRMKKNQGATKKSTGSNIYFHRFETFASLRDKDWFWSLPDGERALGCACGEGWAAVATSRRLIRFFTSGGNQGQLLWLKGDMVTMVGRSRFLAVFYHESNPLLDGTQKLGYTLFDAVSCHIVAQGSLSAVSKRSMLSWAGFTNDYSLVVLDSDGMLSMLISTTVTDGSADAMASSWEWTPILDTIGLRKSAEDSIWPIAVQDGKLVCLPLKGGNQYPDATRRPVTATLSLRLPLARGGAVDKIVMLEELSVRANMALNQKRVMSSYLPDEREDFEEEYQTICAQVDKVTLQLYVAMVEAGKLERALDLVHRLHLEQSIDIAITMADRLNHRNLSDRIEEYKERWLSLKIAALPDQEVEEGALEDNDDDEEEENRINHHHVVVESERQRSSAGRASIIETERATESVRRISPDSYRASKRTFDQVGDEKKSKNPFAKKRLESPAHNSNMVVQSPIRMSPPKPKISRASTFSAKSREQTRVSKNFL